MEKKEIIGHKSNCISQCKIPIYFAKKKKKPTFSILQIHFYKIPTSVCLSYHLFYLTNHFPHFFIIYLKPSLSLSLSLSIHSYLKLSLHSPSETLLSIHDHSSIQALIHHDWNSPIHKHQSTSIDPPQAPIHHSWNLPIHKHQSATNADPLSLSLLGCLCVGVFDFVVSVVDF